MSENPKNIDEKHPDAQSSDGDPALVDRATGEDAACPPWLKNGPLSQKELMILAIQSRVAHSQRPRPAPTAKRRPTAQEIAARLARDRGKTESERQVGAENPWAILREKVLPHEPSSTSVEASTAPWDSMSSLPLRLAPPSGEESGPATEYRIKAPIPHPAENPVQNLKDSLITRYEAAYASLQGDPAQITRETVRAFLAETAALDLELRADIEKFLQEYAPAANEVIAAYIKHKARLDSLIAHGERESGELRPDEDELRIAYAARIERLHADLGATKQAFMQFVVKVLAVINTHKVLEEVLAQRASNTQASSALLKAEIDGSERFHAFDEDFAQAVETTFDLTGGPAAHRPLDPGLLPACLVQIQALLNSYDQPVFLADQIIDNGLTIRPKAQEAPDGSAPDKPEKVIALDLAKIMELTGIHLRALMHGGFDPRVLMEHVQKARNLGSELGFFTRLTREALSPYLN